MGVKVKYNAAKRAWYLYVNDQGKRASKAFGKDEQAARDAAREIAKAIKLGGFHIRSDAEQVTVQAFAEKLLAGRSNKPSTARCYESRARLYVYPVIGSTFLGDVTKEQIQNVITQARASMSARSTRHLVAVLQVIFEAARESGLIAANPAARAGKSITRDHVVTDKLKYLTREQVSELLDAINAAHGATYHALFLCLARSGMRIGEAIALQWSSVDFLRRRILINRTYSERAFTTTKSGKERHVDMSDQLADALAALRDLGGDCSGSTLVFRRAERRRELRLGGVIEDRYLRDHIWHPVAETLKLESTITPHILRHSYASQLISDGTPIAYVSRQLGHASIQITMDVYGHLIPSSDRGAVNSLDEVAAHPGRILSAAAGCGAPAKLQRTKARPVAVLPFRR